MPYQEVETRISSLRPVELQEGEKIDLEQLITGGRGVRHIGESTPLTFPISSKSFTDAISDTLTSAYEAKTGTSPSYGDLEQYEQSQFPLDEQKALRQEQASLADRLRILASKGLVHTKDYGSGYESFTISELGARSLGFHTFRYTVRED